MGNTECETGNGFLINDCTHSQAGMGLGNEAIIIISCSAMQNTYRFIDLPADWLTCASIGDSLLAVGGTYRPPSDQSESSSPITSTAMSRVFRYNPANESWDMVSYMLSARSGCFAVMPSEQELMVLGGGDKGVEIYENFMP